MKIEKLCVAVVSALCVANAAEAAMSNASGVAGVAPPGIRAPSAVLYSQLDNPSGNGAPDQNFEAALDAFDSIAADDFVVPDANGWTIEQISTVGTTGVAGLATVNVSIHANSVGGGNPDLPGAAVCSYSGLTPVDTDGSFVITLPTACIVGPGTYWLAIQTNQDYDAAGQHFWSNRSSQSGSEGVWANPLDGFTSGCTSFAPQTSCGVGGGTNPDFLFQIDGVVGGLIQPSVPVPVDSRLALLALGALLAGAGAFAMRRRFS
jgi:hypothetical protein